MSTLSLRLPESLHRRVKEMASQEGISINQFISTAVAELERVCLHVARTREFASYCVEMGMEPWLPDAQAFRAYIESEADRYKSMLRRLKLA